MTDSLAKAKALHVKYGGHGSFHVKKDGDEYSAHLTSVVDDGCAVILEANEGCEAKLNKDVTANFEQNELRALYDMHVVEVAVPEEPKEEKKPTRRRAKKAEVENEE